MRRTPRMRACTRASPASAPQRNAAAWPLAGRDARRTARAAALDIALRHALAGEAEAGAWHARRRHGTTGAFHRTPGRQGAREDL
jgi:hypothetical protein